MATTAISRTVTIKRTLWATITWGFSLLAVSYSFTFASEAYMQFIQVDPYAKFRIAPTTMNDLILPLAMVGAWFFLAIMTIAWIFNRRCYLAIPIIGTMIGLPTAAYWAAFPVPLALLSYISTVPLAFYLVFWHVNQSPVWSKLIRDD